MIDRRVAWQRIARRLREHPGRGGCGVGAVAELRSGATHEVVELALRGLGCMEHRGGSIDDTGDGAGVLLTTDPAFFARFIAPGRRLPEGHQLCVGVLFFPMGEAQNLPHWQREIDGTLRRHGLAPLGWRHVPVDEAALGAGARASRRDVWHVLMGEGMVETDDLAYVLWKVKAELEQKVHDMYVASLAPRTLVYKALATGEQLRRFYRDLGDPQLRAEAAVFHRRYSTNTFSNWYLAQVFRTLAHNGEINTIKANRNAVANLEGELGLTQVLMPQGSDSADMDRVVELFTSHGVSLLEAVTRMMPPAWRDLTRPAPEERGSASRRAEREGAEQPTDAVRFLRGVQRALGTLGAWEGPAALVATDGEWLVGALDRMGLRPLRWMVTRSGKAIIASELGAIPVPLDDVLETGQLDPGETFALHLPDKAILRPAEVLQRVVQETPINFAELSESRMVPLPRRYEEAPAPAPQPPEPALHLFGWTRERENNVRDMAKDAKEPITSMGHDRPLAVMSAQRPPLAKFFKQIVAVVTNPPLDPIREASAFDLTVHLGEAPQVHENQPVYDPLPAWHLPSPILSPDQMAAVVAGGPDRPRALVLDCTFDDPGDGPQRGAKALARRITEIARQARDAVKRREATVIVLSDRASLEPGKLPLRLPLPMVLVASAVHDRLVARGRRRHAGLVVETGEVQEGHDACVLLANGADAVHPWLFYAVGAAHGPRQSLDKVLDDTVQRVMSKMGICSADGYRGSRLFEAVGLSPNLTEHYLPGVTSRLGGIELEDVYEDLRARAWQAVKPPPRRDTDLGVYRKEVWKELQIVARGHDPDAWRRFVELVESTPPVYLRDLIRFKPGAAPRPLGEVAAERDIVAACFRGAAMSHGALHRVAHRAIAAAFDDLGALSNCGEGGEDPRRDQGGEWEASRSRIRQVASGRFGVDARYLAHADELSIKIGQGAKPGEGGMLPAAKVTAEVAAIRRTQVGVALISPPPHHDIYSIEDLAELVYDLRQVNPRAAVSVKIPAVTDIGTIAVGIAKAGADVIDVSGFEGGTGAASASSIEHAGLPLERALSEVHQALVLNGLRGKVRLRADGGIKTGFDVCAALALGADEVSLGTSLMIAEQCIYCHGCSEGLCPAGITTQSDLVARRLMTEKKGRGKDELLPGADEARYADAREGVKRYLMALAADVRSRLAALGLSRPEELVGRVDLLERRELPAEGERAWVRERAAKVDLAELLAAPEVPWRRAGRAALKVDPTSELNARIANELPREKRLRLPVFNTDRAVGAALAGAVGAGAIAPPPGGWQLELDGYAGQALGFACVDGLRIALDGFANDKVAEAMGGGVVAVRAPRSVPPGDRAVLSLVGNAAAYGATGGALFVEGRAGQRVGVRNSGARIVVEGAGKYAFEYMTGGVGVVLGPVGPVVGSGMTGGVLYLLEAPEDHLDEKLSRDVKRAPLSPGDEAALRALLEEHARESGSHRAAELLARWPAAAGRFAKLVPK